MPRNYTEKKGKSEPEALATVSQEEAFTKDFHGTARNKKEIKAFLPRRRKGRKGKQDIETFLLLLSILSVFAVKILGELASKEMHLPRMTRNKKENQSRKR